MTPYSILAGRAAFLAFAGALAIIRLYLPTSGHSDVNVFMSIAHMFMGALIVLLFLRPKLWPLWTACIAVPSSVQAVLFFVIGPTS